MIGHKMENYQHLRKKNQDLIGKWVISIDLPNQKYEVVNDASKAYFVNPASSPLFRYQFLHPWKP